jgi:hypothetical protein
MWNSQSGAVESTKWGCGIHEVGLWNPQSGKDHLGESTKWSSGYKLLLRLWFITAALEAGYVLFSKNFENTSLHAVHNYVLGLRGSEEKFVHAYIDRHAHLGERNTSRVEGAHARLKEWLRGFKGDFLFVIQRVSKLWRDQWDEATIRLERDRLWNYQNVPKIFHKVRAQIA